ncbi:MAG: Hsp20/alpha crystallin family protein [Candidatus Limnocylindrales bacterium]
MSLIRRSSPFGDVLSLRQAMDHLFEESFVRARSLMSFGDTLLPLDIHTTPDALVVEAALPGVKPEQVEITLSDDTLTISGSNEVKQESDRAGQPGGYLYQEIRRGSFSRTVTLPSDLQTDRAAASFEHGLLRLSIPRAEKTKPRRIAISPTSEASTDGSAAPAPTAEPVAAR